MGSLCGVGWQAGLQGLVHAQGVQASPPAVPALGLTSKW